MGRPACAAGYPSGHGSACAAASHDHAGATGLAPVGGERSSRLAGGSVNVPCQPISCNSYRCRHVCPIQSLTAPISCNSFRCRHVCPIRSPHGPALRPQSPSRLRCRAPPRPRRSRRDLGGSAEHCATAAVPTYVSVGERSAGEPAGHAPAAIRRGDASRRRATRRRRWRSAEHEPGAESSSSRRSSFSRRGPTP